MAKKSDTTLIREERQRLMEVFKGLPEDKLVVVAGLIDQAAFMRITLDRLQESIKGSELTEGYQIGPSQSGVKQSAELQGYNVMVKNYGTVIRLLLQHVPKRSDRQPDNQLMQLLKAKQAMKK